jgi:GGDEF domain-containing protein
VVRLRLRSSRDLRRFAERIQALLEPEDLIGRYGTAEVVVARYGSDGSSPERWLGDLASMVAYVGEAGFPEISDVDGLLDEAEHALRPAGTPQVERET